MGSDLLVAQWLGSVETWDTVDRWLLVGVIDANIWISFPVEANHWCGSLFQAAIKRSLFRRALDALSESLDLDSNSTIFDDDDDFTSSAANLTSDWPVYDEPFNGTSLEFESDMEDSDVDNEDDADEELREEEYSAEEISIATQIVRCLNLSLVVAEPTSAVFNWKFVPY